MHTLDGVYVTLLVLMVVLMLLTFKMYMVQFQCLRNITVVNIFIYRSKLILFVFVTPVSKKKSMNVKILVLSFMSSHCISENADIFFYALNFVL